MAGGLDELLRLAASAILRVLPPDVELLCLQGAALVGMLAASLLVGRRYQLPIRRSGPLAGLTMGVAGYIIGGLVSDYGESEFRPTLVIDFLYLGGYFGGPVGGLLSFALVEGARWQFGGILHPLSALVDGGIHVLSGLLMRRLIDPRALQQVSAAAVLWVWSGRGLSTVLGTWVGLQFSAAPMSSVMQILSSRLSILPVSLLIIYVALMLLCTDAQIDAQLAREHALLRRDPVSGLANRRALSECVQAHWRLDPSRAACLVVVDLVALCGFLSCPGHERAWQRW